MVDGSPDTVSSMVLLNYVKQKLRPPDGQFTILAGFVLCNAEEAQVISLGTGSKCLPAARLPKTGDALHDSHAEVLSRRGAIRWFLEEITRVCSAPGTVSSWIRRMEDGNFALEGGVTLNMYISTVPCRLIHISTLHFGSHYDSRCFHQAEMLPPGTWPLSKTQKWLPSRTPQHFQSFLGTPHPGVATITRSMASCARNLDALTPLRPYPCPAATRSLPGMCWGSKEHCCRTSCGRST